MITNRQRFMAPKPKVWNGRGQPRLLTGLRSLGWWAVTIMAQRPMQYMPATKSPIPATLIGRIGVPYAKSAISAAQMKVVA